MPEDYLAERREWDYESSSDEPEILDGWEEFEKARTEHALELLRNMNLRTGALHRISATTRVLLLHTFTDVNRDPRERVINTGR